MIIPLDRWLQKYGEIARVMGYDVSKDREATRIFAEILRKNRVNPPLGDLKKLLYKKPVIVFGAGPSLDSSLDELVGRDLLSPYTLIAADGATQALTERNIVPHIIVTDLDGDLESMLRATRRGSVIVIHVHGDNIDKVVGGIGRILSSTRKVLGTTQVEPIPPLYNFGGFTDGDRCVFLAASFGAYPIVMVGMDFGKIVGRRSKPWLTSDVYAWEAKERKLRIAYQLISWLALEYNVEVYTVSSNVPPGVEKVEIYELKSILR